MKNKREINDVYFDRYKIVDLVCHGGFSRIYKVKDMNEMGKVKIMKIEDKKSSSLLKHEYLIGKKINESNNQQNNSDDTSSLCKIENFFEDDEHNFIIEELLGKNLSYVRYKNGSPPPIEMLIYIASQVLSALSCLHQIGIYHHDIKPSNLTFRVNSDGYEIVLFDYGLSQLIEDKGGPVDYKGTMHQNMRYLSVHYQNTYEYEEKDDIISLIYTLSELWRGSLPWSSANSPTTMRMQKNNLSMRYLLPSELQFIADDIDKGSLYLHERALDVLSEYQRDIKKELDYLTVGE